MNFDAAVTDSGLADLTVALHLADHRHVVVISKRSPPEGTSNWAQGGVAAVFDSGDSHDEHVDDTLVARVGLCDGTATRYIVENGRSAIGWLIGHDVPFTRDKQTELGFHLTREGDHRHRRIIHAADTAGRAVATTLAGKVHNYPNITLLEDHFAIDLITDAKFDRPNMRYHGLYALDIASGHVRAITAGQAVVATGGAGKVYLCTMNPDTASGDGIAIA